MILGADMLPSIQKRRSNETSHGDEMIRYRGFSKSFGAVTAVHELDLSVAGGETVAVIGPNGSGKTTSLKAAVGLVRPSAGQVLVAGYDTVREGRLARRRLGYLPQRLTFPEGVTAREALSLYARIRGGDGGQIGQLLERVGLTEAADRTAETFSGGMRQRLGLAIALLGAPDALILDEPTAALDPSGALMVRDIVENIRADGTTVLISSHDLAEVSALADRVAIFVAGRLAALGSQEELVRELGLKTLITFALAELGGETGVAASTRLAATVTRAGGRGVRWDGDALHCEVEAGGEPAILEALSQAGVFPAGIKVRAPGLEEVYRAVTGTVAGAPGAGRPRSGRVDSRTAVSTPAGGSGEQDERGAGVRRSEVVRDGVGLDGGVR